MANDYRLIGIWLAASLLFGCATPDKAPKVLPRDLMVLVDESGNKATLQSIEVGCPKGWRRFIQMDRAGNASMGCWAISKDGSLTLDFEDGTRTVIKKENMRRGPRVNET